MNFKKKDFNIIKNEVLLFFYISINYLLIFLRDVCGYSINKFFIIAISGMLLFALNKNNLVKAIFFTLPMLCGMPANYMVIMLLVAYMLKIKRIDVQTIIVILVFFLIEIINSFQYVEIFDVLGYISHLFLFLLIIKNYRLYTSKVIMQFFIFGIVSTFSIILICAIRDLGSNWLVMLNNGWLRLGFIYESVDEELRTSLHPNSIGNYANCAILCSILLIRDGYKKVLNSFCVVFCLICLALSMSRSAIITLMIFIIIYLISVNKMTKFIRNILFITISGLAVYLIIDNYFPSVMAGLIARFTDQTMVTGNNRSTLFITYMSYFFSNLKVFFVGTGVTSYVDQLIPSVANEAIHNSLVQLLVCYGLPLTILFIVYQLRIVLTHRRKIEFVYWIPLLAAVFFSMFSQLITPYYNLFPILLGYSVIHTKRNEKT